MYKYIYEYIYLYIYIYTYTVWKRNKEREGRKKIDAKKRTVSSKVTLKVRKGKGRKRGTAKETPSYIPFLDIYIYIYTHTEEEPEWWKGRETASARSVFDRQRNEDRMDEAIVKEREREETGLRQRKKDRGSLTRGSWFPRLRSIPPPSLASLSPLHTTLLLVLLFRLVLPRSNNSPSRRLLSFYSVIRLSPFNSLEKKKECSFLVSHYRDYI